MERISNSITELIGSTPLLRARRIEEAEGLSARLLLKLEYFNPLGSVKDRAAYYMVNDAEEKGILKPGGVIIEPTSGNTGVGLAYISAVRGYRLILTMPETMSAERVNLLRALGAELVLTPGAEGMAGSIAKANEIASETPGAFMPMQFENPANARAHYETTGPEILKDTGGNVDYLICGVGSGGTLTGTGRALKETKPNVKVVAVEPSASPVLSGGKPGPHGIQGIGANFIPKLLDTDIIDEIASVSNEQAYEAVRMLVKYEGVFAGISAGAALHAAVAVAKRSENSGKTLVVVIPDTGERYLSTPLYSVSES